MNNVTNHSIIRPNHKKNIPNLGMVRNGQTGSLIIEFEIEFPESLTPEVIGQLRDIL
jgi:DnaJ-class molecular chaperone